MPQAPAKAARSMEKIDKEASMLRPPLLSAVFLLSAPALAQNYGGTYTAKNASGGNVMLTLTQDGQKRVNGTLTGYGSPSRRGAASAGPPPCVSAPGWRKGRSRTPRPCSDPTTSASDPGEPCRITGSCE